MQVGRCVGGQIVPVGVENREHLRGGVLRRAEFRLDVVVHLVLGEDGAEFVGQAADVRDLCRRGRCDGHGVRSSCARAV